MIVETCWNMMLKWLKRLNVEVQWPGLNNALNMRQCDARLEFAHLCQVFQKAVPGPGITGMAFCFLRQACKIIQNGPKNGCLPYESLESCYTDSSYVVLHWICDLQLSMISSNCVLLRLSLARRAATLAISSVGKSIAWVARLALSQ